MPAYYDEDGDEKKVEEIKLTTKVTATTIQSQYAKAVTLMDLFALFSEARAEAAKIGWETAILDPIEEMLRKLKG